MNARSVVVMDYVGGDILYEKDADIPIPPASLTKLMTMRILYEEIAAGRLRMDDIVIVQPEDCALPYNSSLMYLQPYMRVPVRVLMLGLCVVSGNDAARALARTVSGSIEAFAGAERGGPGSGAFGDPFRGALRPVRIEYDHAREMAEFSLRYLKDFPILEGFSFRPVDRVPRRGVYAPGVPPPKGRIVQYNNNKLVRTYPGADGLKTGYIDESGFNLVATAERDGTRFVIVTLGGSGVSSLHGGDVRARDGRELLDWAFDTFRTVRPEVGDIQPVRLWKTERGPLCPGRRRSIRSRPSPPWPTGCAPGWKRPPAWWGRAAGTGGGPRRLLRGGKDIRTVALLADQDYPEGNLWIRFRDGIALFFRRIFHKGL